MIYAFDDFTIDTDRFHLAGPDGPIEAEPQALEFLIHMIRNRGQLVTKEMLHNTFWPDRVVSDAALSTLVRNARRLVGDSGEEQRIIATRHGRGFVFRAEVEEREGPEVVGEAMRDAVAPARPRVEGAPAGAAARAPRPARRRQVSKHFGRNRSQEAGSRPLSGNPPICKA